MTEINASGTVEEGEALTARTAAERLTFFSDAVVAIAITLLAIELPVPTGETTADLVASLRREAFEYLSFLISFLVIGTHWRIHHGVFRHVRRADGAVVPLSLLWLLLIVLNPFITSILNEGDGVTFVRFTVYAGVQTLQLLAMAAIKGVILHRGWYAPTAPLALTRRGWLTSVIPAVSFVVSIPAFLLVGTWAFALWAVLPAALARFSTRAGLIPPD